MDKRTTIMWEKLIVFPLFLFIAGCTSISSPPSGPSAGSASPPGISDSVYRSDEYIIYRMRKGDTSASLAQRFLGDSELVWRIEEANQEFEPDRYIIIPLKPRNKGGIFNDGVQQIPILCYHRFGNHSNSPLCIPEDVFERQMRYLKDRGYSVIKPEQLLAFLEYRQPMPKKSVMITVDDGYMSFYTTALPILKKYRFTATLFIYLDFVGASSEALNWGKLQELKAGGFYIGSHSMVHSDLSKQGEQESYEAYMARLRYEIFESKKKIDARLNQDTFIFAYPFGRANDNAVLMAQQAGYKIAMTVKRGGNPFYSNPFALQRDQVLEKDMEIFVTRLKTFQPFSLIR